MSKLIFNYGNHRIELDYGDSAAISTGGPTDEGFSYNTVEFKRDSESGIITAESTTNARDCDGPIDYYSDYLIMIDITGTARFHKLTDKQRDYYAEAMGY